MFELNYTMWDRWEKYIKEGKFELVVREYDDKYRNQKVGEAISFCSIKLRNDALEKLGVKCLRFNRIKR